MSKNPPAYFPDNDLTRAFIGSNGSPVSGTPLPTTRSAALGRPADPPPLTNSEREELDRKAQALGILPKSEELEGTSYQSMSSALEAGAPVVKRVQPIAPATQYILPDFTRIDRIDLNRGVVVIGDLEFEIPKSDVDIFKKYSLTVARAAIDKRLTEALEEMSDDESEAGEPQEVQQVQEEKGTE